MQKTTQLKVQEFLTRTKLTLLTDINGILNCKSKIVVSCKCGEPYTPRISDLPKHSGKCRACADKQRPKPSAEKMEALTEAARVANTKPKEWTYIRKIGNGAKERCKPGRSKDYGDRGIEFKFRNGTDFAEYVLKTLGPRPSNRHSIDRIDNDGHYAKDNLRWATYAEQANNKRKYRRRIHGERLDKLIELRPDYCYETLRTFILQGLTDDEIVSKIKWNSCGIRHTQLRT